MIWRIIKFLDGFAILVNENNEELILPHKLLPPDFNIAEQFTISFNKLEESTPEDRDKKNIINTLLKAE